MKAYRVAAVFLTTVLAIGGIALAQQGFSRKILQDKDLSVPDRHMVQAIAEFGAGATSGRHTHPGDEVLFILEGELVIEIDGKPTTTAKAGDFAFIPAGVVHQGKTATSGSAKVLATYILEKGKPVATPAP